MVEGHVLALLAVLGQAPDWIGASEAGNHARALRLARQAVQGEALDPDARISARLTELVTLLALKRHDETGPTLEDLARENVELGPWGLHIQVVSEVAAGRCLEARKHAESLAPESVFFAMSYARIVRCAIRQRDAELFESALETYQRNTIDDWQSADAMALQARWFETNGSLSEAAQAYRKVRHRFPMTKASTEATLRQAALAARGFRVKPLTGAELLPRAWAERRRVHKAAARRTFSQILRQALTERSARTACQARIGLAEIDIVGRSYRRALRRLSEVTNRSGVPEQAAHALYLRGDVLSRLGRVEESIASYEAATALYPTTAYAAESALAAARMAYSSRQFDRAMHSVTWLQNRSTGDPSTAAIITEDGAIKARHRTIQTRRSEAAWIGSRIARRQNESAEETQWLSGIARGGPFGRAASYWMARAAGLSGRDLEAQDYQNRILDTAPFDFYAFASRDLLCPNPSQCEREPTIAITQSVGPPSTIDLTGLAILEQLGLQRAALAELRSIPLEQSTPQDRLFAVWLYYRAGDLYHATKLSRGLVSVESVVHEPALMLAGYPRGYRELVEREARRSEVPTALIYAIIREESGFRARAVSPRVARGLMQMIPRTARRMARSAGLSGFSLAQLYTPEISIRLGAHYLKLLLERFDGDIVAAVASYHAGERTVGRWKRQHASLAVDDFIEDIPYVSTRGYVKKVLGSYGVYRSMLEPGGPRLQIDLEKIIPLRPESRSG
ncbi:MAG: transglycosylase SLT domain-containing protein [Myxococcota bacterium]